MLYIIILGESPVPPVRHLGRGTGVALFAVSTSPIVDETTRCDRSRVDLW
jgi:hypothetical protein